MSWGKRESLPGSKAWRTLWPRGLQGTQDLQPEVDRLPEPCLALQLSSSVTNWSCGTPHGKINTISCACFRRR